jgi:hypothetical protein
VGNWSHSGTSVLHVDLRACAMIVDRNSELLLCSVDFELCACDTRVFSWGMSRPVELLYTRAQNVESDHFDATATTFQR